MGTTETPALQKSGEADILRLVNRALGSGDADGVARALFDLIGKIGEVEDEEARHRLAFFARFQTLLYMDDALDGLKHMAAFHPSPAHKFDAPLCEVRPGVCGHDFRRTPRARAV